MQQALYSKAIEQKQELGTQFVVVAGVLFAGGLLVLMLWGEFVAMLRYVFPAMAFGLGALFYWARPGAYMMFVWWIWFLSPFLRRVIDAQVGWEDPNTVLLAPYLAAGVTVFTLLTNLHKLLERRYFPFLLVFLAIGVGYLLALINLSPVGATNQLLQWVVPVLFGFHVAVTWQHYPTYRRAAESAFVWGALVLGLYALYQFFFLPEWDRFWMVNVEMGSIGAPRPFAVRVFSMVNSPAAYSYVLIPGLLLLFQGNRLMHYIAAVPGFAGFLLSLVRASWGGWVLGLAFIALRATGKMRTRLLTVLTVSALISLPLLASDAIFSKISVRFDTFSNLEGDGSMQARLSAYQGVGGRILSTPQGYGLGGAAGGGQKQGRVMTESGVLDSGILAIPLELGWLGAMLYAGGLIGLLIPLLRSHASRHDFFALSSVGVVMALGAMLALGKTHMAVGGAVLWCFFGLAMAADTYHAAEEEHPINTVG